MSLLVDDLASGVCSKRWDFANTNKRNVSEQL